MKKNKPKIKCDISQNWAKASFIPTEGEIIIYSDLKKIKIGNGYKSINELPFEEGPKNYYEGKFILQEGIEK